MGGANTPVRGDLVPADAETRARAESPEGGPDVHGSAGLCASLSLISWVTALTRGGLIDLIRKMHSYFSFVSV